MSVLTLTDAERDVLGYAIAAYGSARAGQVLADLGVHQPAADQRVDAAWALVLSLLYPGHVTGTVPEPITPVAYLPRAMLHVETCATPGCLETDIKPDGEAAYCKDHR